MPELIGNLGTRTSPCGTSSQSDSDKSPENLEKSSEWSFQWYLFCVFQQIAHRWNIWSWSSGSGRTAIFTTSACPCLAYGKLWKVLTSKLTRSKSQILCRALDGYRLEPMPPQQLVLAAASPDGAAAASPGSSHGPGESRQSRHGEAQRLLWVPAEAPLLFLAAVSLSLSVQTLQSLHWSPCSAFLRVDGCSEWSFENELSLSWADSHKITPGAWQQEAYTLAGSGFQK